MSEALELGAQVSEASRRDGAIVALETTIVAHGFPPGVGEKVGRECEEAVRAAGATPATIGVLDGRVHVGLSEGELARFDASARKVGARDLGACIAAGAAGATTAGATLAVCRAAGIRFMATGGLGGVHRNFPSQLDVSADLTELGRTPALVVSAGAKSLLDVPATAEALEALSIPVLGYRTREMPLFYTQGGGPPVSEQVETPEQAADVARAHWRLGLEGALVLVQPPPRSVAGVEPLIERALADAEEQGVRGPALTPHVLAFLHRESGGETLAVNRELAVANASLAARVAVAYAAG